jgi:protein TonB
VIQWPSLATGTDGAAAEPVELSLAEASQPARPVDWPATAERRSGDLASEAPPAVDRATAPPGLRRWRMAALAASLSAHAMLVAAAILLISQEGLDAPTDAISVEIVVEPAPNPLAEAAVASQAAPPTELAETPTDEAETTAPGAAAVPATPEPATEAAVDAAVAPPTSPAETPLAEATAPDAALDPVPTEPPAETALAPQAGDARPSPLPPAPSAGLEPAPAAPSPAETSARIAPDIVVDAAAAAPPSPPLAPVAAPETAPADLNSSPVAAEPPDSASPVASEETGPVEATLPVPSVEVLAAAAPDDVARQTVEAMLPDLALQPPPRFPPPAAVAEAPSPPQPAVRAPPADLRGDPSGPAFTKPGGSQRAEPARPRAAVPAAAIAARPAPAKRKAVPTAAGETPRPAARAADAGDRAAGKGKARAPASTASAAASASAAAGDRTSYGRLVNGHVQRYKRYPESAARGGLRGAVKVSIGVGASGNLASARISASSGHKVLDDEALATVRRAAPYPKPPASFGGTARLSLTLRYSR